ncbi:MAG: MMPL family transporter [Rhodospirillales bacterium]|nr:MMPL family transporter [Rhodospirillales bacterium]
MIEVVRSVPRRLLLWWTFVVGRFAWPVVVASAAVTVAAAAYVIANFAINTSHADMFSEDLPFQRIEKRLNAAFPQEKNSVVVVIGAPTPGLADDAGDRLAARLAERPHLFPHVFDLQGSAFFRRNGLLYLDVDALYALADRLLEAQPFIDALWRDPSLRGLAALLAAAADATVETPADVPFDLSPILNDIAAVAEATAAERPGSLSWQRLMGGGAVQEAQRRVFQVSIALDYSRFRPAQAAVDTIRSAAAELGYTPERGYRVRLTGPGALNDDELQSVSIGVGLAGVVSLVLIVGLLLICFRSPRLLVASLFTLIAGLIWTAAFAVAAVGTLNLISVAFAVLFIGLGVDFGIHYALAYRECKEAGGDHTAALQATARRVGAGIPLSAIAAAIGFYAFLPTNYTGLAELGLIAGTGMIIALFASFTVLPAWMTIIEPRLRKPVPWEATAQLDAANWIRRHHRPILASAAALAVVSAALVPLARFDFDPLNLKDRDSESVATLLEMAVAKPTSIYAVSVLANDLESAAALAPKLAALDAVQSTRTLASFVPANQDEKLDIIDNLALFLGPTFAASPAPAPDEGETVLALQDLQDRLQRLADRRDGPTAEAAARLRSALEALMEQRARKPDVLGELEDRLLGGLHGRLDTLRRSLAAEPVALESLPIDLRERWVAPGGEARLEVYPAPGISTSQDALRSFVEQIQAVAPDAAGPPVIILEAGKAVVRAFLEAAAIAIIAIAAMLAIVFRRKSDIVIVFTPLALAALLTVAASVVIGIPFNFANVIVLPLLFGIGVAGSLHLVVGEARGIAAGARAGQVMGSSTPRAVVFSALTTIASFGSLALSQHPGTSGMGVLLTVAIGLTLVCTIIVLPALLVVAEHARQP